MSCRKWLLSTLFLAFLLGCPETCEKYNTLIIDPSITFIGDSLFVAGAENCASVPHGLSFARGKKVLSHAVWGATTQQIRNQFQFVGVANTVIFDGGANDLLQGCKDEELPNCVQDVDAATVNLRAIIDSARVYEKRLIFIRYYAMAGEMTKYETAKNLLMDRIQGIQVVDLKSVFTGHPEYVQTDGIHPTTDGVKAIVKAIEGVL